MAFLSCIFLFVLHYIQPADKPYVTFRIYDFTHSPSPYYVLFFLFNCLSSHTTILSSFSSTFLPQHLKTLPCSCFFSCSPFSCHYFMSLLLHRFLLCRASVLRWVLPQRVVKTPSAVHAAPACPASTGTPKRRSPHCSSESPMAARVTLCPPLACGWAPA